MSSVRVGIWTDENGTRREAFLASNGYVTLLHGGVWMRFDNGLLASKAGYEIAWSEPIPLDQSPKKSPAHNRRTGTCKNYRMEDADGEAFLFSDGRVYTPVGIYNDLPRAESAGYSFEWDDPLSAVAAKEEAPPLTPETKLPTESGWYLTRYMNHEWRPRYVLVVPSDCVYVECHWSTCPTFHALWKIGRRISLDDPMNPVEPDSRDEWTDEVVRDLMGERNAALAEVTRLKAELAAAAKPWPDDAPRVGLVKASGMFEIWFPKTVAKYPVKIYDNTGCYVGNKNFGEIEVDWLTTPPPQPSLIERGRKVLADAGIEGLDVVAKGGG